MPYCKSFMLKRLIIVRASPTKKVVVKGKQVVRIV